jgi:hypothetical protein
MRRPRRGVGTTTVVVAVVIVVVVATMAFAVLSLQTSTPPHGTSSNALSASSSSTSPSSAPTISNSSMTTYTVSNGLAAGTFEYPNIPANLTLATFSFLIIYNGTGYVAANGTEYMGFDVVFSVTNQSLSQTVIFQWGPYGPTTNLPSPTTVSLYGGAVTMNWTTTSSAYPYVSGPAAFLNILVKTPSG